MVTLFSSTLTLVGVVVIMLLLDVQLALVVFLTFPLLAIASVVFRIVAASAYRITRERIAEVTAYLQESLSGVRVVRSFAQEQRHMTRMAELNELNRQANMKTVYLNASYFPAVELLSAIGTAVILLYGGYQAIDLATESARDAQIGVVVAFVGYLSTFFDPIQQLSQPLHDLPAGDGGAGQDLRPARHRARHGRQARRARPRGAARRDRAATGVWFSYGLDKTSGVKRSSGLIETGPDEEEDDAAWALEDVSIHVPAGETLALVGETGAGKSTFAKLVARFYDPQRGRVLVDGHDLRDLSSSACAASSGSCRRRAFSSPEPCGRTSPSGGPTRATRRSRRQPTRSAPGSSSGGCPTGSRPRSASAACPCRRASGS